MYLFNKLVNNSEKNPIIGCFKLKTGKFTIVSLYNRNYKYEIKKNYFILGPHLLLK